VSSGTLNSTIPYYNISVKLCHRQLCSNMQWSEFSDPDWSQKNTMLWYLHTQTAHIKFTAYLAV